MNAIPVIVFDANKRKYIEVGRSDAADPVTVLEQHGKAIADVFGDEYRAVKPKDFSAAGRAVRKYNREAAIETAAWNFRANNGMSFNLPEPVSVEHDPEACVTPPDEFFPDADAQCWCIPGFHGDNERKAMTHLDAYERAAIKKVADI